MSDEVKSADLAHLIGERDPIVNDFQIIIATVNGTGSQTANTVLLRALFRMGIPVNGKNIFPSNIQGLPTWFTIRASKDGYMARRETNEVLVAFNQATYAQDIAELPEGGICFYPEDWGITPTREDISFYPMPVGELIGTIDVPANLKDYIANMVYVGCVAAILDIDRDEIEASLDFHFSSKAKPIQLNMSVVNAAYEWALDNLAKTDPYRVERMGQNDDLILLDGNSAGGLGAVFGGVSMIAWYPITPSTSLIDAAREYLNDLRRDPDSGLATYAIIQAEDEIAAIGMVIGAGWAGARSMTSTSGPGLSLMTEFAGLAYFAEVPAVIWDIQRVGPSTGLPTRSSQGDLMTAYFLGHGDSRHVCLLPATIGECFEFGWRAFDLAERLQTPIFVLSDLDLGMNLWMSDVFDYPDQPMDRGKVLTAEDLDRLGRFARYEDADGDGIGPRTLPGTDHPLAAYFTRGTGHNEYAIYSERPEDWLANMARLGRKFDTARTLVPKPIIDEVEKAKIGLIAYGTTHHPVVEALDRLRQYDISPSYLRLRALPLNEIAHDFITRHERIYVIENNNDGQMANLIHMEYPELASRVISLAHLDGMPLTARWITEAVIEQEGVH